MKIRVEVSDEDLGKALLQKAIDMLNELPGASRVFPYPYDFRTSGNLVMFGQERYRLLVGRKRGLGGNLWAIDIKEGLLWI